MIPETKLPGDFLLMVCYNNCGNVSTPMDVIHLLKLKQWPVKLRLNACSEIVTIKCMESYQQETKIHVNINQIAIIIQEIRFIVSKEVEQLMVARYVLAVDSQVIQNSIAILKSMDHLITHYKDQEIVNHQHQTFIKIKRIQIELIIDPHILPHYVLYNGTAMEHAAQIILVALPVIIKIQSTALFLIGNHKSHQKRLWTTGAVLMYKCCSIFSHQPNTQHDSLPVCFSALLHQEEETVAAINFGQEISTHHENSSKKVKPAPYPTAPAKSDTKPS
uniref:Uncharacterized protein n=1 Tax=Romanomermis culicivorax TaxID=13658 RepID=A0A915IPZ9_ROMCU